MTEVVQRRFCPLLLLNAPQEIDSEVAFLISQLNDQTFVYMKNDEMGSSGTTFIRLMTIEKFILRYADIKHARTSLSCKEIWDRFPVSAPSVLISEACKYVNSEIAHKILDGVMNDGLTTFDQPVALINLMSEDAETNGMLKDRIGDLPVRPSIELDISLGTDVPDMSLDFWIGLVKRITSEQLVPYSDQLLSDTTIKSQSKAVQSTFGFATKLFSMSKKYLTQTNSSLTGLKHSEETVVTVASAEVIASTASLRESELQLRRAADLSFMLRNYKRASALYDALRKDAQASKNWSVTASAHQWSLISKLLADASTTLPGQDLGHIIQQYLLASETHFSAAHLVTLLSILAVPIQVRFPLLSILIQSKIEPIWKLAPLILQMDTAIVLKKNRMALLLVDLFVACCERLGLYSIELMSLRVAHLIIDPSLQIYFFPLYQRLLALSQQLGCSIDQDIARTVLSNPTKLDIQQAKACWKSVAVNNVVEGIVSIVSVKFNGKSDSRFDLHDFETFRCFTEMLWNSTNAAIDPLRLLVQTHETVAAAGDLVLVEILVANIYPFPILFESAELEFEGPSNVEMVAKNSHVSLSANSVQSLSFTVKCDHAANLKLKSLLITTEDNLTFRAPLNPKGFRLNFTKAQRITPTYSEFHGNHICYLPVDQFVKTEFKFLGDSTGQVALYQESIFEIKMHCNQDMKLNIAVLSDCLLPLDHETDNIGGISVLKGLILKARKPKTILFRSLIDTTGPIDFVLAIYSQEESAMQPIMRRVKIESVPLMNVSGIHYHGFDQTSEKLISLVLTNASRENLKVFETSLNLSGLNIGALGLSAFEVRPDSPFTLIFPLKTFRNLDATLTLRLQDGRILHIVIPIVLPSGPVAVYRKISSPRQLTSGYLGQDYTATIQNSAFFEIEEAESIVLGEVLLHQKSSGQDISISTTIISKGSL